MARVRRGGYVLLSWKGDHAPQHVAVYRDGELVLKLSYLRDVLLYKLTLEAQKRIARSSLAKREIVRRLGTSPAQLCRLLDQTNYRKSIDQLLALLHVLDCDVDLVVRTKTA